jgi:hypothetical protein
MEASWYLALSSEAVRISAEVLKREVHGTV